MFSITLTINTETHNNAIFSDATYDIVQNFDDADSMLKWLVYLEELEGYGRLVPVVSAQSHSKQELITIVNG